METYFNKKEGKPLPKLSMPTPVPNAEPDEPPAPQPAVAESRSRRPATSRRAGGN